MWLQEDWLGGRRGRSRSVSSTAKAIGGAGRRGTWACRGEGACRQAEWLGAGGGRNVLVGRQTGGSRKGRLHRSVEMRGDGPLMPVSRNRKPVPSRRLKICRTVHTAAPLTCFSGVRRPQVGRDGDAQSGDVGDQRQRHRHHLRSVMGEAGRVRGEEGREPVVAVGWKPSRHASSGPAGQTGVAGC